MNHSELLDELVSIKRRTHADLSAGAWRWLLVWAVISLGFVVMLAVPGFHGPARWYWTLAVPLGLGATMVADRWNTDSDSRVRRRDRPYWLTTAGMIVLTTGGGFILPGRWPLVWLWVVFAGGFAVLLGLEGERRLSQALWLLTATFAVLAAIAVDPWSTSMTFGGLLSLALVFAAKASHSRWLT
ncbi:MAG TPA: hypothetical protein VMS74_05255 [Acidimicrobiia bacterium]|nr:hypothetical protein [Acidimicrobiia bacterium]